jgi:ABC-2 type transport system ATP-binding protein
VIEVQSLSKSYNARKVVDSIDLSIERGSTFGFLGPNGAGKTTSISMLVGLLKPDAGKVTIAGGDPSSPSIRKRIGIAPQSLSLYDNLSAADNLRFFGTMYQLTGTRLSERVAWALQFAGLVDRSNDRVATFSGGMKRRLNIAVGLVHEPDVLLLDEPTVGVDPQSRNHIMQSVAQLARDGLTIIFTTHYMEEAEKLCDRVAIIDHGRILANESIPSLLERFGRKSTITATLNDVPESLKLPGTVSDNTLQFQAEQPVDELARLQSLGVRFGQVRIDKPNLESVFLSLTGRSLRD